MTHILAVLYDYDNANIFRNTYNNIWIIRDVAKGQPNYGSNSIAVFGLSRPPLCPYFWLPDGSSTMMQPCDEQRRTNNALFVVRSGTDCPILIPTFDGYTLSLEIDVSQDF
jgi:hypothetical protein